MSAKILHEKILKCYQNLIQAYVKYNLSIRDLVASRAQYNLGVVTIFTQAGHMTHGQSLLQYFFTESIELRFKNFLKPVQKLTLGEEQDFEDQKDLKDRIDLVLASVASILSTIETMKEDQTPVVRGNVKCSCGEIMVHEQDMASLVCTKCGVMQHAFGLSTDDCGDKAKRNTNYMPTSHATNWLLKIQGRETCDLKELSEVVDLVRAQAISENTPIHQLTCDAIRRYLRLVGKTSFNDHCPAIRTHITNIQSPILSNEISATIINYFDIAIRIFNKICKSQKNAPYHPYFIYKIIEQKCIAIPPHDKKMLLENIHLQAPRTLRQNDNIWREICREIPQFVYIPTSPVAA